MPSRRRVRRAALEVQQSTALHGVARAGLFANGVLHIIIGGIAVAVAFGEKGRADHDGALAQLAAGPIGGLLLWLVVLSLWGLALFRALSAVLVRGSWTDRLNPAARALAYAAFGFIAFRFATGNAPQGSEAQEVSHDLLTWPFGSVLVALLGAGILAAGVSFVVIGVRRRFLRTLKAPNRLVRRVASIAGVIGYIANGVALSAIGVLFIVAAVQSDSNEAAGLDGALESLRRLPLGNVVLCAVAVGFVLFGFYCLLRAAFERLESR